MTKQGDIQSHALAGFFSANVFKQLSTKGCSPALARLIRESGLRLDWHSSDPISTVFDEALTVLKRRAHRHEYVYKAVLTEKVLLGIHSLNTASMMTEFRVGVCKADVVILNGTGTVYEIKSERDGLQRLRTQVDEYSSVFAAVNVIAGDNHLSAIRKQIPSHVGIQALTARNQVSVVREAVVDPSRTSPAAIFQAISQREAQLILSAAGWDAPDVPNTKRFEVLRERFVTLDSEFAHRTMVQVLRRTRNQSGLRELLDSVPKSLRATVMAGRFSKRNQGRFVRALQTPISEAMGWG